MCCKEPEYFVSPENNPWLNSTNVYKCTTCNGFKTVSRPPWVAGDQTEWTGTSTDLYPCPTCDAKGWIKA